MERRSVLFHFRHDRNTVTTPVSWASTVPVTHLTEADAKVENLKAFSESPENTETQATEPVAGVNALPLSDVVDSIRREVPAATPLLYTDTLTTIYAEHQLKPPKIYGKKRVCPWKISWRKPHLPDSSRSSRPG